ncbi:Ger(x)C family spore germination protein [Paenibacillus monticola]|uniref:Ger(X)C family spore germination protein n=1 Tax=Paenibacillus monticola TaxID=2666075 RepID=A0A7X2H8I3_9BACL|nr:Ger(x)C family spore germination protein [Paenibacillus monticola]MRN55499.1 Ger(x)C family spore germination protein [Paenibacillus monticola]
MKRAGVIMMLLAACVLLSACWSSTPIEDLNLIVGIALDSADETEVEAGFEREGGNYPKEDKISCTYQFMIPQGAAGPQKGSSQTRNFNNITETGDSIFEAIRELLLRTNRPLNGYHLKTVVIGEQLARSMNISELIGFYTRDNNIRPNVLLLVSRGRARDVLNNALPGQIPAFVLEGIFNNRDRNTKIWEPVSMAMVVGPLYGKTSFLLQNVNSAGKEPKFAGAGVIKGKTGKLIGFLDESELEGMVWVTGKGKGGVLKTYDPDRDKLLTYEIKSMSSKIKAKVEGDDISFVVNIKSSGRYAEVLASGGKKLDKAWVEKDEKTLQKQVEKLAQSTVDKMQHELHVDVAGFGKSLHIQFPSVWRKVKEDWDETFSEIPVTYEVNIDIEEYGASGITAD